MVSLTDDVMIRYLSVNNSNLLNLTLAEYKREVFNRIYMNVNQHAQLCLPLCLQFCSGELKW